jgi:hypothetical protein
VLTTGATVAALSACLRGHGIPVRFAATLAATELRSQVGTGSADRAPPGNYRRTADSSPIGRIFSNPSVNGG